MYNPAMEDDGIRTLMLTEDHLMVWLPHPGAGGLTDCCARGLERMGLLEGESRVYAWRCPSCGKSWEGGEDSPTGRTIVIESDVSTVCRLA